MNPAALYRTAPVGFFYFDRDLRFLYVNEWLANINGLAVEQHVGQRIGDILPNVAAVVTPQLIDVIRTGNPILRGQAFVETAAHPGSKRHYEHSYYPDKSGDGIVVGLSCVVEDVTERIKADEGLRTTTNHLGVWIDQRLALKPVVYGQHQGTVPPRLSSHE